MLRIKEIRKEKGITAKELAEYVNVAESTMSLYENGKREPDFRTLINIAKYLEVSIDEIFGSPTQKESSNKNRIKCLRKLRNLSQTDFAKEFNVEQTAVSNWEQGRNNIDISIASKIAEEYKVPVEFVYGFEFEIRRPIQEWFEDELEDMNKEDPEARDFFLFRFGKGFFSQTHHPENTPDFASPKAKQITEIEEKILELYRKHPEMQEAVNKLLGVEDTYYAVASSKENHPDQYTQKSTEFSVKLEDTPENDEPLT